MSANIFVQMMIKIKRSSVGRMKINMIKNMGSLSDIQKQKKKAWRPFPQEWAAHGLPMPEYEYMFHKAYVTGIYEPLKLKKIRGIKTPYFKSRLDIAFWEVRLGIEIQGGLFIKGGHVRGFQYIADMKKKNLAKQCGWTLVEYAPNAINYQQVFDMYETAKHILQRKG
jgi:hypothetical protein